MEPPNDRDGVRPTDESRTEQPEDGALVPYKSADKQGPGMSVPEAKEVTRARARDLRALLGHYIRRHVPSSEGKKTSVEEPGRQVGTHARALMWLRLVPWLLLLLFAGSFLWDFDGMRLAIGGRELVLDGLLRILAVGGLIGFGTNWLAITMLFNPRKKRPILGQGLIPAQRERVIYRLARAVSDELINEEIIKQKIEDAQIIPRYRELAMSVTRGVLEDEDFRKDLKALTGDYVQTVLTSDEVRRRIVEIVIDKIEGYVGEGVGSLALKAYRYLNEDDFKRRIDKAVLALPGSLDIVLDEMDALLDRLPEKIEARAEDIETWATRAVLGFVEQLDVYSMIMGNMSRYDDRKLEDLLKRTTNEQLNYIKYLGGILGFVGGLVIWQPLLSIAVLGATGSLLWVLDETIYRFRQEKPSA